MSPRPNVTEERTSQIINAAVEVFAAKGFDEARMDDIAEETGLSKGTLYLYFNSKDDLIIAILNQIFQREFKQFEDIENENLGAVDAILKFTETVTNDIGTLLRVIPVVYEFLSLAFRNRYVKAVLKEYLGRYLNLITVMVQRGIDTGELRQVDPREVAIAAGAIVEGTVLLWVYDRNAIDPERHIRSSIELLLEGILAKP